MEPQEKEQMLYDQIASSIESIIRENELTYAQIIGVLEMIKEDFIFEAKNINLDMEE